MLKNQKQVFDTIDKKFKDAGELFDKQNKDHFNIEANLTNKTQELTQKCEVAVESVKQNIQQNMDLIQKVEYEAKKCNQALEEFKSDEMFINSKDNFNKLYVQLTDHKNELAQFKSKLAQAATKEGMHDMFGYLRDNQEKHQKSLQFLTIKVDELNDQNEQ